MKNTFKHKHVARARQKLLFSFPVPLFLYFFLGFGGEQADVCELEQSIMNNFLLRSFAKMNEGSALNEHFYRPAELTCVW